MKIAICGLINSDNLGEQFISKSLEYLILDELKSIPDFVEVDIKAKKKGGGSHNQANKKSIILYYARHPLEMLYLLLKRIVRNISCIKIKNSVHIFRHLIWLSSKNMGIRVKNYFESIFTECDLIVIDGAGLLEYSYNEYQEYLYSLIETAQENNIPVVCNAIGCAGEFNKDDYRCKLLIKAFHSPCIMYVSARDSRESVQECVGTRLNVKLLADAAFVVDEAFNVKAQSKHCIGIGLIRGNATLSYSKGFDENDWINLYYDIAKELTKQGFSYEFFTNGSECDYRTGLKVIEKLGESRDKLVDRPHKPETLLKTIASYDGIITCRMHSSIAAFSLRIPSVILSWNNKVDKYMEQVGYPKRAIKQDLFEASYIVYQLKNAMQEGISESNYNRMKSLARESVKDFISLI